MRTWFLPINTTQNRLKNIHNWKAALEYQPAISDRPWQTTVICKRFFVSATKYCSDCQSPLWSVWGETGILANEWRIFLLMVWWVLIGRCVQDCGVLLWQGWFGWGGFSDKNLGWSGPGEVRVYGSQCMIVYTCDLWLRTNLPFPPRLKIGYQNLIRNLNGNTKQLQGL